MAREVNLTFANFQPTGTNVQVPVYQMDVTFLWTNNVGVPKSNTRQMRFPNLLNQVDDQEWVEEQLRDLMIRAARKIAGVDDE